MPFQGLLVLLVSTHSRPKAAASSFITPNHCTIGFNSQPPEGGCKRVVQRGWLTVRFNSQPPEGGCGIGAVALSLNGWFQLTAARRRLHIAGWGGARRDRNFNSQPPEGGCCGNTPAATCNSRFQLTAARRRLRTCNG